MKKKPSQPKLIRVSAKDIKPPTKADMERLEAAMNGPIDTTEMPEWTEADFRKATRGTGSRPGKRRNAKSTQGKVA